MTTPALPEPIEIYFRANRSFDVDGMLLPFASDALVGDERKTHQGTEQIRAWIMEATVGNKAVAAPQLVTSEGDVHHVTAEVTGDFPGSPITLTFHFTLSGGKIARLEIG